MALAVGVVPALWLGEELVIRVSLTECQWGVEPIDNGVQINLLEPDANTMYQVPFSGDALGELMALIIPQLSPAQRAKAVEALEA